MSAMIPSNSRRRSLILAAGAGLVTLLALIPAGASAAWPPALRVADGDLTVHRSRGMAMRKYAVKPGSPFSRKLESLLNEGDWSFSFDTYAPEIFVGGKVGQKDFLVHVQKGLLIVNVPGHLQRIRKLNLEDYDRLCALLSKESGKDRDLFPDGRGKPEG